MSFARRMAILAVIPFIWGCMGTVYIPDAPDATDVDYAPVDTDIGDVDTDTGSLCTSADWQDANPDLLEINMTARKVTVYRPSLQGCPVPFRVQVELWWGDIEFDLQTEDFSEDQAVILFDRFTTDPFSVPDSVPDKIILRFEADPGTYYDTIFTVTYSNLGEHMVN